MDSAIGGLGKVGLPTFTCSHVKNLTGGLEFRAWAQHGAARVACDSNPSSSPELEGVFTSGLIYVLRPPGHARGTRTTRTRGRRIWASEGSRGSTLTHAQGGRILSVISPLACAAAPMLSAVDVDRSPTGDVRCIGDCPDREMRWNNCLETHNIS